MRDVMLDRTTADRLLSGRLQADDAPPGYVEVVTLLNDLSEAARGVGSTREDKTVAAMVEIVGSHAPRVGASTTRRRSARRGVFRAKVAALVIVGTLLGTTGLAFAGALPGAAQDVASVMLAKVGITVPGPNAHAGSHPDSRGQSETAPPTDTQGSEISDLARTTTATGVDKGAAISTAASDGQSQAGTHDSAEGAGEAGTHGAAGSSISGHGGSGTADTASDGSNAAGSSTADTKSQGHSAAGSHNAGS